MKIKSIPSLSFLLEFSNIYDLKNHNSKIEYLKLIASFLKEENSFNDLKTLFTDEELDFDLKERIIDKMRLIAQKEGNVSKEEVLSFLSEIKTSNNNLKIYIEKTINLLNDVVLLN